VCVYVCFWVANFHNFVGGKIKQKLVGDVILFSKKSPKFYDFINMNIILFREEVCHILVVFLVQGTCIQIVLRYLDCQLMLNLFMG